LIKGAAIVAGFHRVPIILKLIGLLDTATRAFHGLNHFFKFIYFFLQFRQLPENYR
jgi:hypothetical protein